MQKNVEEFQLHEVYHSYLIVEADDLTEKLRDRIEIHEDDCYALCTGYCTAAGILQYAVLAVGSSWENCSRGLKMDEVLGFFRLDELVGRAGRTVRPEPAAEKKAVRFLSGQETETDEDVLMLRQDARLDPLRDLTFPDVVCVGILEDTQIVEYDVRLTGIDGPFVKGALLEEADGYERFDTVKALPYEYRGMMRLLAMFIGDDLTPQEQDTLDRIREVSDRFGVSFHGVSVRS